MKAIVGAFNQEKVLVGAFSVIVQPVVEPMDHFTALVGSDDGDPEDIVDTPATISVRKLAPCPVSGPGLVPRLPPTPDTVSSLQFLATSGRTESIVDHGHIKAEEVALKHGDRRHQGETK